MLTHGSVPVRRPWQRTSTLQWLRSPLPTVGLTVALALAMARVGWNLARPQDIFLDSWVLVHLLQALDGEASLLPRAALTLHYPLSYLPLFPLAKVFGPFTTVKLLYPIIALLAAVPAYLLVRRGPAPVVGIIAMLALPDLAVKALNGTPQGVALPLFLLTLYFAVHRRRKGFVATAVAILFTHHLTGLITLVLYYAMWVLPRSRDRGFLRGEWPYLLFFSAWPLYWAWTFSNTGQWYMAPILLVLTVAIGLPIAVVLYLAAPHTRQAVDWAGARAAALSPLRLVALAVGVAAAGLLLSGVTLETPGLSTGGLANRLVVALYAVLLVIAGAAILARRDHGLALFAAILLALGSAVVGMGC